jgi:hypothetical protein
MYGGRIGLDPLGFYAYQGRGIFADTVAAVIEVVALEEDIGRVSRFHPEVAIVGDKKNTAA